MLTVSEDQTSEAGLSGFLRGGGLGRDIVGKVNSSGVARCGFVQV
jgi:hypothetical protein